ncbi:MAG TPA: hypothetical protein VFG20_23365 [Planctomycetaceae bacterium]|nr:hypothetical protein [Planctomycetaceae bacterium]
MRRAAIIGAGLAGLGALTLGVVLLLGMPARSSQPAPAVPPAPPSQEPRIGDRVIIGMLEDDDPKHLICMVRDIQDRTEIEALVASRDVEGMRQALGYRRASLIPNRSPAVLLQLGRDLCRVRILDGDTRGREGWLPPEYILRRAI